MKTDQLQHMLQNNSNIKTQQPLSSHTSQLRELWKEAFGDSDTFLDVFASTAFAPNRCRCVTVDGNVVSALYWFDCSFQGRPIAYIYAVATKKAYQGQGLCHQLMEDTHGHLRSLGYAGAILVPGSDNLFQFYEKVGYQTCTYINKISANANLNGLHACEKNLTIRTIAKEEYGRLRRDFLPKDGILQEKENLDFLETQVQFLVGDDFLLAATINGTTMNGLELLGNTSRVTEILQALNCSHGRFRTPGDEIPFAMYYGLDESTDLPEYFGFAFD